MQILYRKYVKSLGESPYLARTARVVDAELGFWTEGPQFYMNLSHIASLKRFGLR